MDKIDKSKYTPMMQHYLQLKEENPDAILMYRLGDFYEMFFDDAKTVSRELDLVLTGRSAGAEKAPMCGVPFRAAKSYITRLVKKGYKVAICEQLEDPKEAKGLVERGIIQIVTPGTLLEEENSKRSLNYLAVLASDHLHILVLLCELSTGELRFTQMEKSITAVRSLLNELQVKEVVASRKLDKTWQAALKADEDLTFSIGSPAPLTPFDESLIPYPDKLIEQALSLLTGYLQATSMQHADHLMKMTPLFPEACMILDSETRMHLELTRSSSSSSKATSLWEFMDHTKSAQGGRLLREWIEAPLLSVGEITARQDAVQTLLDQFLIRASLQDHLSFIYDLERLAARISYRSASPRDVLQLSASLEHATPILDLASCLDSFPMIQEVDNCQDLYMQIKDAIVAEPPLSTKDGNYIADGYDAELDEVRRLVTSSDEALMELEARERERTGIKNLKIGYNRVFGYYVEVRNSQLSQITPDLGYTQNQTLANSARFTFDELKQLEDKILNAQERKIVLEEELFSRLLETIKSRLADLHQLSKALSLIDVLVSLADLAAMQGYERPEFTQTRSVEIVEGRHPILDERMPSFVSNNWTMDENCDICLITGPNMGGKSTWLRQNALIVIMAQIGSFVPARKAKLPVFDRIFTRIGASDDLLQGKSTFMTEMMEANNALRHATKNSLILFDEIGRGTATYDGMALARAMLEYLSGAIGAKTLFSTHYHELTELEETIDNLRNVHVDVRENKGKIEFLYRIVEGKADKSYGIHVAKLAGLPKIVINRADDLLHEFEADSPASNIPSSLFVMDPEDLDRMALIEKIQKIDPDSLSAKEALDILYRLKQEADKLS